MDEDRLLRRDHDKPRLPLTEDTGRLDMIDRQKRMSLEERIELFEALSRDAAWVRSSAKRIR